MDSASPLTRPSTGRPNEQPSTNDFDHGPEVGHPEAVWDLAVVVSPC